MHSQQFTCVLTGLSVKVHVMLWQFKGLSDQCKMYYFASILVACLRGLILEAPVLSVINDRQWSFSAGGDMCCNLSNAAPGRGACRS